MTVLVLRLKRVLSTAVCPRVRPGLELVLDLETPMHVLALETGTEG